MQNPLPVPAGQVSLTYVDRPEVSETFVDSLEKCMFDGLTVRLEFVVNRFEQPNPGEQPAAQKLTAVRLLMTVPGFLSILAHGNNMLATLQKQGVVQPVPMPPVGSKPN